MRRISAVAGDSRPEIACIAAMVVAVPLGLEVPTALKALSLVVALALIVWGGPLAGLSMVCASLPLASFVFIVGSSEWSPLELALLACGAATGVAFLNDLARERNVIAIRRWIGPWDVALIGSALVIVAGLSLTWVADPDLRSDSLRAFRRVIVEPLFVVPAMAVMTSTRSETRLSRWLVYPAVVVSILALGQLAFQRSTVDIGGIARPIGTFTHPNNLSFYLERVIWFAPLVALPAVRRYGRGFWLIAGLILIATLATLSRGAAVALAAGALVMFWEIIRARWRMFVAVAVAGAALVFASRYLADSGDSIDSRTTIWRAALDMIRDHPLTGVGLDQFLGQYGRRYVRPEGWPERYTSHPHNVVLDFWLSLGIAGLAILWLLIEVVWRRVRAALSVPSLSVQRAGVAMLVAGLAHGLIDNSFFLPYLATLTWIGLSAGYQRQAEPGGG